MPRSSRTTAAFVFFGLLLVLVVGLTFGFSAVCFGHLGVGSVDFDGLDPGVGLGETVTWELSGLELTVLTGEEAGLGTEELCAASALTTTSSNSSLTAVDSKFSSLLVSWARTTK